MRDLILGVDRHRERFDRRQVQAIELVRWLLAVLDPAHRSAKRQVGDNQQRDDDREGAEVELSGVCDDEGLRRTLR